jgi:hypothetical protein
MFPIRECRVLPTGRLGGLRGRKEEEERTGCARTSRKQRGKRGPIRPDQSEHRKTPDRVYPHLHTPIDTCYQGQPTPDGLLEKSSGSYFRRQRRYRLPLRKITASFWRRRNATGSEKRRYVNIGRVYLRREFRLNVTAIIT